MFLKKHPKFSYTKKKTCSYDENKYISKEFFVGGTGLQNCMG